MAEELVFDNNTIDDLDKKDVKILCKKWNLSCDERREPDNKIKDLRRSIETLVAELRWKHGYEAPDKIESDQDTDPDFQSEKSRSDRGRTKKTKFKDWDLQTEHDDDDDSYDASSQSSGLHERVKNDNRLRHDIEEMNRRFEALNHDEVVDTEIGELNVTEYNRDENEWLSHEIKDGELDNYAHDPPLY